MFKRNKIEVIQPRDYSYVETLNYYGGRSITEHNRSGSLTLIPSLFIVSSLFSGINNASATSGEWALQTVPTTSVLPTGAIADKSLEILAGVLDPVVQILVAISFPVASVIMIGACFFFMFGNSERAWGMIMNAGLGYVLIQISPLFLEILRTVGEAI